MAITKLADYTNGNVHIQLFSDGTRIMETDDDEFKFDFPTNIDMTITHKCKNECPYCYLGCNLEGRHADLRNVKFFDTFNPGQELAINLNNLDHPQLMDFLHDMHSRGVVVNGTVNQIDFEENWQMLNFMCEVGYLWGIGISLVKPTEEFIKLVKKFPNAVIHVINGVFSSTDIEMLRDNDLKLLILGYKNLGRGTSYKDENGIEIQLRQSYLKDMLPTMFHHFKVISFDNAALEQLEVRKLLSDDEWEKFYQGDEGTSTFALDLVDGTFAMNSTITDPDYIHPVTDDIKEMFSIIKKEVQDGKRV